MVADARPLILVVEDEPGAALLQRRRLERAGFRVRVATENDAAMQMLSEGGVALMVIDYRLGDSTGLDLHRRMKAAGFDVPVIVVSGAMDDATIIEALRAGVRDVVVKNVEYLEYLPHAVRGALAQVGNRDAASRDARGGCVLVVEDDHGVATLERRQLERAGYEVTTAATAEDAVQIVRKGHVNVALIDLRLNGAESGLDLYERLKEEGWSIPAILVTAFPDQAVAIRALRAGVRDFVPKTADFLDYLPQAVDRVTAQVRIERKLAESELRLASIIGTTLDAILMCNEDLRVILFNRAAEQMFGCRARDAFNRELREFLPTLQLKEAIDRNVGEAFGAVRRRQELDAVTAAGESVPVEVTLNDVIVHGERLFTIIARDISRRRRIENELREADRRKDQFLGMLAHELRNPLAAVMNATEVLHHQLGDPNALKLVGVVKRQSSALARMVDDLLDVSRVTLGKIQLHLEPMLLSQVVQRAADNMRDAALKAGLTLCTEIDAQPVWLNVDATRLEQVLANLLNNALKFTPSGGRIEVRAARDGDWGVIRVRDTGVGMDPALLTRAFDLFVQGDTSLDRAKSGLGIGLALVRQVVQMHGGTVSAASEGHGRGSEFTVRLPAAPDEAGRSKRDELAAPDVTQRLRILVVDDQRDVADSVAALVTALGHTVRVLYDAAAALDEARREAPHVMLVDVGMPAITGYELARQVRADPNLERVRLIALTGYGREEDRALAFDAGFHSHLAKPASAEKLQAALAGR